ncbi:MAG: hypothetical protein A2Y40_01875 [Candidatus Margulisbacteria bacterium GWF2_35_9]|nr:MAG: hypothetical protein A2Y40_01875 [Candidatus Margulisbacteria bacterium GWF2_35_9]
MKRTLLLLLIVSSFLMAASDTDTLSIMVNVKSIFSLEIDRHIVDFKTLLPGQMMRDMPDNEGVKVTAKSNNGNGWVLKISNLAELSDGSELIPNKYFYWSGYPSRSASGTWYGKGTDNLSLTPVLAYSASMSEYNNYPAGTDLYFKFDLKVPDKQKSGIYRSIVAFTLTE